ncbi:type II toxin-antitoxin system MqsA family antitoxin [Cellulomonas sp. Y8]|uniref:type II toxin-antitoxin system MqsA family antitoxin n=1 Tax=Cellulomonas sp. Y8 TaxID=2591145 RepID=UPI00143DACE6|nr:type II toxin-antitoxin system MqsA family antitoxin [Cellulomonas sp. Y8]
MDCARCDGTRVPATRPRVVERDGRLAVVRDVPVEICDNCGEVYLDAAVAMQLDVLFRQMLGGPVEQAVGRFVPAAA